MMQSEAPDPRISDPARQPQRRPSTAVRFPTRRVITCTSRRRLGATARISRWNCPREISRSLAARSTSDGFPANPICHSKADISALRNAPPTARDRSRCAREFRPSNARGAAEGLGHTTRCVSDRDQKSFSPVKAGEASPRLSPPRPLPAALPPCSSCRSNRREFPFAQRTPTHVAPPAQCPAA